VAVITHEVWTCDFCGKPIASGKGLKGTLTLRKQGVKFEELIFPDEIHGFLTEKRWLQAYGAAANFLSTHLN